MKSSGFIFRYGFVLSLVGLTGMMMASCTSTSSSYSADRETEAVGEYGVAPRNVERPRAGVPDFDIQDNDLGKNAAAVAADQLTTLLINSGRFRVIERAQLDQVLEEQNRESVRSDEKAKKKQVRGVNYLLIGKITNFKLQRVEQGSDLGVGQVDLPGDGGFGGLDVSKDETVVKANVGVDLRLVDPETGEAFLADSSDFTRVNKASSMGVEVLGSGAESDSNLQIKKDNQGKILRLALDDTLQKMMPKIDRMLRRRHKSDGNSSN